MRPVTVVKLGGSAITDKSKDCTPDLPVIHRSAEQISRYKEPLIVLHGGGSFAHPIVRRARLQDGYRDRSQLEQVSETELFLDQLTRIVGVSLLLVGKPFVPIRPLSFVLMRNGRIVDAFVRPIEKAVDLGLVPLIHGDLAFDLVKGFGVLSADTLASFLGSSFRALRVLYGCDVDGVYTGNPKVSASAQIIPRVDRTNATRVLRSLRRERTSDATGGMLGKVKEAVQLAKNGCECHIFNLKRENALEKALQGAPSTGTRFVPW